MLNLCTMTFGFYAIIFFSLKMLTLPDINHNVPLCWLLVIGRKGVSSCATDTARLWRQASTRSTLLIPFNWILFINCFCFMGGGRGKGNSMHKISIFKGSVEISTIGIISCIYFSFSLCCYLSLIFITQQWILKFWHVKQKCNSLEGLDYLWMFPK